MKGVPAHCQRCGSVFNLVGLIDGQATAYFSNDNVINCPICDGSAVIGEGTYRFDGIETELLDASAWTREMFDRLSEIASESAGSSPDEILSHVEKVSPDLAGQLRKRKWTGRELGLALALFVSNCQNAVNLNLDVSLDVNRLIDQVKSVRPDNAGFRYQAPDPSPLATQHPLEISAASRPQPNRQARRRLKAQSRKPKTTT